MKKTILLCLTFAPVVRCHAQNVIPVKPDYMENGANRRVTSPVGYGGVWTYFYPPTELKNLQQVIGSKILNKDIPDCSTPIPGVISAGTKVTGPTRKDVPQMYVGITGRPNLEVLEVDAGMTIEFPKGVNTEIGGQSGTHDLTPDAYWTLFCRVNGVDKYGKPSPSCGGGYQSLHDARTRELAPKWNAGQWTKKVGIGLIVYDGAVFFLWDTGEGQRYHFSSLPLGSGNQPIPASQLVANAKVKRVIAMTQQKGVDLDGSMMIAAASTDGLIDPIEVVTGAASVGDPSNSSSHIRWSQKGGNAKHIYPSFRYGGNKSQKRSDIPFVIQTHDLHTNADTRNPITGEAYINPSGTIPFDGEGVTIKMNSTASGMGKPKGRGK